MSGRASRSRDVAPATPGVGAPVLRPQLEGLLDGRPDHPATLDVSIVIVTYESRSEIEGCLRSIEPAAPGLRLEVRVVDNASTDGTADWIAEHRPDVSLIRNARNRGYGRANNQALADVRGRYVLLLNPDCRLEPGSLKQLLAIAEEREEAGILGCRLLMSDDGLDLACRRSFPTPLVSLYRMCGLSRLFPRSPRFGRYNLSFLDPEGTYEVDAVVGAFLLMRRELLEEIGGFDPDFFLYGEDLDLCWRAKEAGSKVLYVGSIVARHRKRASSSRRPLKSRYHFHQAMLRFYRKNLRASYPMWVGGLVAAAVWARMALSLGGAVAVGGFRKLDRIVLRKDRQRT